MIGDSGGNERMGMMRWLVIVITFVLVGCADEASWRVGAAKVAITPERPVWLAGYSRDGMSGGVHDDIWARPLRSGGML